MAFKNKKNFAISELASGMNDSQLTATVKAGEGVKFPSTNFWFIVDVEIMLCSSRTGDVLTITRGDQSTTPVTHNTAARCYNAPTIACVEDLEAAFPASAVNENVVVFDGVTGEKIKDSGATKANLDDAIIKKHTQDTDQKLDDGGVNEVTAANAKDAVDKKHTSGGETQGGDISGTVSNATVNKIKGKTVDEGAIADDKILVYKTATSTYVFEAKPQGVSYAQYVTVAKSNGDYTTIQAALNSISDAATDKRYAILIYPGTYDEEVTCKSWVDLIGLSRHVCIITKSDGEVLNSANDCEVINLTIKSTYGGMNEAIELCNTTNTFVLRNCYIEKIVSYNGYIGIIAGQTGQSSNVKDLQMYDCKVHCENTYSTGQVRAFYCIKEATIERCDIYAKAGASATGISWNFQFNANGVRTCYIRKTTIEMAGPGQTGYGAIYFYGSSATIIKIYDSELIASGGIDTSISSQHSAPLIHLKSVYANGSIISNITLTLLDDPAYIKNTAAGMIVATTVQAAINELDVEKVGILANTAATYTRTAKIPATAARVGSTAPTEVTIVNTRGLGFNADAELAFLAVPIPLDWNGISDIILKTAFCGTAGDAIANGETVKFDISYNSVAENEAVDNGTEATATITYTQSGAGTDKQMIIVSITIPYNDANQPITAGDALFIKFNRDVTTDTYSGMAIVQAWALQYTSNCVPK